MRHPTNKQERREIRVRKHSPKHGTTKRHTCDKAYKRTKLNPREYNFNV